MTAIEILVKYLEQLSVEYIFGIPGGAIEPLYSAVSKSKKVEMILTKHEGGAAFMADAYARVSGKLGVCCATTGPGATNLVTGVASACADSTPLLVITAQNPTNTFGKVAFQESTSYAIDIVEIFRHVTKSSTMVVRSDKVGEMTRHALRTALTGRRGPVHLNLPMDVMRGDIEEAVIQHDQFISTSRPCCSSEDIGKAVSLLLSAARPAMLIGNGVSIADASDEALQIAELLSVPVATTPQAKGSFPDNHSLSLGVLGIGGSPQADAYLLGEGLSNDGNNANNNFRSDVLLAVGTTFNEWATHNWDNRLIPGKGIIQVDIDPCEVGRNYPVEVSLVGDAKVILMELKSALEKRIGSFTEAKKSEFEKNTQHLKDDLSLLKRKINRYSDKEKMESDAVPLKPQRLMKEIRESCPEDTIFFVDNCNCLAWTFHYLDIYRPHSFHSGLGFASMGFGTAANVGAKLAAPHRPVVSIVGDGCFLMNGMELATAVNYNIQVIWIILNDSQLGMVTHGRRLAGMEHTNATNYPEVDFVKIAEGLGGRGIRVTKPGEINRKMMDEIIASGQPTVIDVMIDKDEVPPLGLRVKAVKDAYFK